MEYAPLSAYGAVGNDDRVALICRDGSVDWCPFPHLESPSLFASILDAERGGHFAIRPTNEYESQQRYVERTNVLETVFETADGRAVLTDFMPVGGEDVYAQQALYRRLECEEGSVEATVSFAPRFDYARAETSLRETDGGVLAIGNGSREHERERVSLHGTVDLRVDDETATGTVDLEAGESAWLGLHYGTERRPSREAFEDALEETVSYWREWIGGCEGDAPTLFDGEWGDAVTRSALVLKLLTHAETGAIPAAATTSIPEEIGGDRNWDYRYNWIRDAKFTVQALYNIGQTQEASDYFEWFLEIAHDDPAEIRPLYGLHGETEIEEIELSHFEGYRQTTPVRVGNGAADQHQLDAYGTIVQGIYETVRHEDVLTDDVWADLREIVEYVREVWEEPDAGIWEFRDDPRHFVHSKLLAWVALDRGLSLADEYDFDAPFEEWETTRAEIRRAICEHGFSESANSFVQYFDAEEALDATALLVPIYGFLPPDDERVQGTIDAVCDRLTTDDGLVRRFVDSEVREDEHAGFVLCSFWLVDALVLSERTDEAQTVFDAVLERASPLGLFSEKLDPESGELLGNFPQAFSHIGLINSAVYLEKARGNGPGENLEPEEFADLESTMFGRDS
ncbi:glycoside hydrolase family 15 protein [Natronobiforma cellulositropha]|uniref:glycoside hydrolase family 15 protein n=1 Tax=Natronobiforma cellulositropha TaxID=1679076 RepID=UPI0021D56B95|nr:glycoside hydrolase family 15 protein [Natronobiforma cellulositropha]